MYLIGVCCGSGGRETRLVLIRRERRGVDKRYWVQTVENHPPDSSKAMVAERIAEFYQRRELSTAGIQFSQIGRPRRRTRKPPTVLVDVTETDAILDDLQERRVRFHTVRREPDSGAWRIFHRIGRSGGEFYLPSDELDLCLDQVRSEGRLLLSAEEGATLRRRPPWTDAGIAVAVGICVWYQENLQQIRKLQPAAGILPI